MWVLCVSLPLKFNKAMLRFCDESRNAAELHAPYLIQPTSPFTSAALWECHQNIQFVQWLKHNPFLATLHLIYLGFLGGQAQDRWEESYQFNVIFISLNCLQSKWVHGWQREIIVLPPLTNYMYTLSTLYTVKTNTYYTYIYFLSSSSSNR